MINDAYNVESRKLKKPSILETSFNAVLQLPAMESEQMKSIVEEIDPEFVCLGEYRAGSFRVNQQSGEVFNDGKPAFKGHRFHKGQKAFLVLENTSDGQHINFCYSILPPYSSWEDFTAQALAFFRGFVKRFELCVIKKLAIRTIDELKVPSSNNRLVAISDLLKTVPAGIDRLPNGRIKEFIFRDVVYYPEHEVEAATVRALKPGDGKNLPSMILDTDVATLCGLDAKNEDDLMRKLNQIRFVRHHLFFGSIGNKALEACDD